MVLQLNHLHSKFHRLFNKGLWHIFKWFIMFSSFLSICGIRHLVIWTRLLQCGHNSYVSVECWFKSSTLFFSVLKSLILCKFYRNRRTFLTILLFLNIIVISKLPLLRFLPLYQPRMPICHRWCSSIWRLNVMPLLTVSTSWPATLA